MPNQHCDVAGCDRPRYARQPYCEPHYRRLRRTGSLDPGRAIGATVQAKPCMVDSCGNTSTERGLCHGHYLRLIRVGELQPDRPLSRRVNDVCTVDQCGNPATARGLCNAHRHRQRVHGGVDADRPIKQTGGVGHVHHGYMRIPVPAELRWLTGGAGMETEHRLVMAQMLGRPLESDESVHHLNGDRLDNRPENLELWSRYQPRGQRVADKLAWAIDLLERYAPEAFAGQLPLML